MNKCKCNNSIITNFTVNSTITINLTNFIKINKNKCNNNICNNNNNNNNINNSNNKNKPLKSNKKKKLIKNITKNNTLEKMEKRNHIKVKRKINIGVIDKTIKMIRKLIKKIRNNINQKIKIENPEIMRMIKYIKRKMERDQINRESTTKM